MPLQAGDRVGPYDVIGSIGAGGMGEVYRARDPRIGRDVAIKVLPAGFAEHPERLARFEQEARTAGALNHPNLLVIFDIGTHGGSPYLVTELLEGESLRQRLEHGPIPLRRIVEWATQIAEGTAAAHEKGIVHRDIKPENIFIGRDERVKLLDFGLAKLLADDLSDGSFGDAVTRARQTSAGTVLGTPGYMAPEQVRGEPVDERADIFALGIVLAEMVTGTHPFNRATRVETMTAILQSDIALPDSIPPALARVIDHMLAKEARSRFQSMKDVAFALRMLSGSQSSDNASGRLAPLRPRRSEPQNFLKLTLRRGRIGNARFTPDGTIAVGASWEGNPLEIFLLTPGKLEAIPIGLPGGDILAVSPAGDLAVSLDRTFAGGWVAHGTLARMRTIGTAPRRIHERVVDADWSPDGKSMAIIRNANDGTFVLEHPIGRPLRVSGGWLSHVRFSLDGSRIAFIDHPWFGDDAGRPVVIDLDGREMMKAANVSTSTSGLAWSPDGTEVWIAGERSGLGRDILGYDSAGNERLVLSSPGQMSLYDTRPNGEILVSHDNHRREVYSARRGETSEKNLAWYDWPFISAISNDGSEILIEEQRARSKGSAGPPFFLRPVDGGPAVHIGDGRARCISPDGKWIVADTGVPGHLELIPPGIGESKLVKVDQFIEAMWWSWFPDGKHLLVLGNARDQTRLSLLISIETGEAKPAGPGNLVWPCAVSPDGERIVAPGSDERLVIHRTAGGGEPPVLPGAVPGDWPICWSADGSAVYVYPRGRTSLTIDRVDVATGERTVWQEIRPSDGAGILDVFPVWLTSDGERYAYSYRRCLSDLYLVMRPEE